MIYLDNAATTKPKKEVIDSMMVYFCNKWENPSSLYSDAKFVKNDVEKSRKIVADFINANPEEIIFTSGGSESNCTAIQGFINYWKSRGFKTAIITSVIEHKSIMECVDNTAPELYYVNVDEYGYINYNMLRNILEKIDKNIKVLVSIQFANNEIGTIQNIKVISELVHAYNGVFHTDAVQAFGHVGIDVKYLGIDMMSASGHKIGTPKGIGILYKRKDVNIKPIIYGSQESGLRGGTENVPYIIGFGVATSIAKRTRQENESKIRYIRDKFMTRLQIELGCKINGAFGKGRLSNNINVTFVKNNITNESLIYAMDMSDIYFSSGSACDSYSIKPSHVLKAIGLDDRDIIKTVRFTINENLTESEINTVISELKRCISLLTFSATDIIKDNDVYIIRGEK